MKRRNFLQYSAMLATGLPGLSLAMSSKPGIDYTLVMEETPITIIPGTQTQALTFNDGFPAPILRAKQGVPIRIAVENRMQQPTTIHWHGIRIDNAMDGVPWLTQKPIAPGETFIYEFTCPDAGTFWYHPHLNSLEQLSKGLVGVLIVDEAEVPSFDREVILGFKDWHLKPDGSFDRFSTPRNAARMGTLGNIQTVNGKIKPVYEIPAGGSVRVRCLNLDNTRVFRLAVKDESIRATLLATDGMPLAEPELLHERSEVYGIGAGMRMDIGFIAPYNPDEEVILYDKRGNFHFEVCRFKIVENKNKREPATQLPTLPANPLPVPDLNNAELLKFVFEWEGALSPANEEGEVKHTFWTINRRSWEGAGPNSIPEPLATLRLGNSYILELYNNTPHQHPIHMHGEIFTVLSSNQKQIKPHQADTVLLARNERVRIAFKASNPGHWMFHCHVIEHMKTGLMGYITIA